MSAEDIEYVGDYKEFPTKESAIDWLDNYLSLDERNNLIRALEQEPCEDVISRQEVIDACDQSINLFEAVDRIKELPTVTPTACIAKVTFDKDELQKIVDEKVKELTLTQEWIPVSERHPEDETFVLTTIKLPNRIARARSGWYNDGFFYNDNGDTWKATDKEVMAWMPLPEPYKGESEEKNE